MLNNGRDRRVLMQPLAEEREFGPRAHRLGPHLHTQRHHPEVEDARRQLHLVRVVGEHERLAPQQHRDGRVGDLQRLPFTAHWPHPFRPAGGQQVEGALQIDGVAHVEQPVHDGGTGLDRYERLVNPFHAYQHTPEAGDVIAFTDRRLSVDV